MREESQLDEWLLLKAAPYTDWHVDIDKPETSVVFLSENETGEALVHAQPMRVPEPLRPLLFHLIERLQAHVSAGDPHSFAIDLGSMRFRGERLRPARYALRRTQQRVESLKALRLGAGAEQLLLDPEFCSGGLILISGEHGAGKSTTARATVVDRLKTYGGYCLTVESPVEVEFEGFHGAGYIEQVDATQMGYKYEVETAMRKFPAAMRSLFYFGEVLEERSAAELVRLAPRGNLVITTIHGKSPEDAIRMLIALAERGGETYARQLLGSSMRAVVHQRLMRGQALVDCFKAIEPIRNVIANPNVSLSNLHATIDQAKRELAAHILRDTVSTATAGTPGMRP
ncbi:Putative type II secretion system protein E [Candidatus Glomeribacter gigasporarum BEG34]|uniref:Putative type II secretion system protein E n=1 Tax=Candidatus Glomeribacter gigasporarum BEG34 TaxID=1070319 RepID=G2J841_9BURK|nr:ATPase, T2SS/T4P/T4SS family [Candidatus Glomeribacter gigasporarum]CCD28938.1 Putative type II secretion system protein E [Candidatus Glomeribacter gigasporarum BEG34]